MNTKIVIQCAQTLRFLRVLPFNLRMKGMESVQVQIFRFKNDSSSIEALDELDPEKVDELCDKSRLEPADYRKLHQLPPILSEAEKNIMDMQNYRKLYGLYGSGAGINVAALWPSKEELALQKEYEQVAHPHTVQEMMEIEKQKKIETEKEIAAKQELVQKNMGKLQEWIADVRNKMNLQEEERLLFVAKKRKQLEEVRRTLGYNIDPKDPKFTETIAQMEEEEKKQAKKAKKLKKQQMLLDDLKIIAEEADKQAKQDEVQTEGMQQPPQTSGDSLKDR